MMTIIKRLAFGFDDAGNLWLGIADNGCEATDYRIQVLDPDDAKKFIDQLNEKRES